MKTSNLQKGFLLLTLLLLGACAGNQGKDELFDESFEAQSAQQEEMANEEEGMDAEVAEALDAEAEEFDVNQMIAKENPSPQPPVENSDANEMESSEEIAENAEQNERTVASVSNPSESTEEQGSIELEAVDVQSDSEENTLLVENSDSDIKSENEAPTTTLEQESKLEIAKTIEPKSQIIEKMESVDTAKSKISEDADTAKIAKVELAPEIPNKVQVRAGLLLNRYYFIREIDTPQSVSTLIYGNPDSSETLLASIGGKEQWKTGAIVYYASPDKPNDEVMRSFYYERTVQPETYALREGDTLESVATEKYGSPESWREIATINQIQKQDALVSGRLLALAPADLKDYDHKNWKIAQAAVSQKNAKKQLAQKEKPQVEQASVGIGSFFRQNALLLGAALIIGVAALIFLVVIPGNERF